MSILLPGSCSCTIQPKTRFKREKSPLRILGPMLPALHHLSRLMLFILCLSVFFHPALAQQPSNLVAELPNTPDPQKPTQPLLGSITGIVTDQDGDFIPGANVTLSLRNQPPSADQHTISGSDGHFSFTNVPAGPFKLTISAPGFSTQQTPGSLLAGQQAELPPISLPAAANIDIDVIASPHEVAQAQIKAEEKQRVLGVIPNFYVSYDPHPAPLAPKQKFELAWKTNIDPVNFAVTGIIAGVQQSQDTFGGYGQGAQGYAKRYAAAYADGFIGSMLGSAILPTVFKQDPRYFYKGIGSVRSRALYAMANAVICKGDNGRWQPNYSNILGNLAAGGISNLYYPPADRDGVKLTFEDAVLGLAAGAGANLFQEFLIRKITPHVRPPIPIAPVATHP